MKDIRKALVIAISLSCLMLAFNGCSSKSKTEVMLDEGDTKFENADFKDASNIFSDVIKNEPKNLKAYFKLASANLCIDCNLDEFWNDINRITVVDPSLYNLLITPMTTQNSYRDLLKVYQDRKKKLLEISDEISVFTTAINKNPGNANLYFGRGYWYHFLKMYKEAVNDFFIATRLNKNFENAFIMLGQSYIWGFRDYSTQNYIDYFENRYRSEYFFHRALQINPRNTKTMHQAMYADDGENSRSQIIEMLSRIISVDSTDQSALLRRVSYRNGTKDYKGAMHDYALLVKIAPGNSDYWVGLGMQKINLGMKKEGMNDFKKALAICKDKTYMKVIQGMIEKYRTSK
ncbi:MAG: hypothetical protein FIA82_14040 [Melioribacter sp.]|nr:hypothetical protein [Melioribacter sp.]